MRLTSYDTLVFDCDGVILDSNRVKSEAFRQATLHYGEAAAQAMVDFHITRGGISRYEKFRHFLDVFGKGGLEEELAILLEHYAAAVQDGLRRCRVTPGLEELRMATPQVNWLIVSGGDQVELRQIFVERGLNGLFDGGIFGSPDDKIEIITREKAKGTIRNKALFLGDSRYDHEAASCCGLDFVFVSGWSEFKEHPAYCAAHHIPTVLKVAEMLTENWTVGN